MRAWGRPVCVALGVAVAGPAAPGRAADPVFTDVTVAAGVSYLQYDVVDPATSDGILHMTGGAAAGDYDGDDAVDLFVTRVAAPGILFRNRGDGTFEDVTASAGLAGIQPANSNGAAWGDVDNDGDLDLYVTSITGMRHYLFINDGAGGFTEEAMGRGAAIAGPDEHNGFSVAFGDYDVDGWLDIHTTEWRPDARNPGGAPSNARLLRNLGAASPGHYEDTTLAAGVALDGIPGPQAGSFSFTSRFEDMDGDLCPELVIASDFSESRLFWNNRDGTFTDGTLGAGVGSDENGMGSTVGDYDGDGDLDWFVTSILDPDDTCATEACNWGTTGNRLYRNEGGRLFSNQTDSAGVRNGYWGWGTTFFDYDNDGDLDLVMTNGIDFPLNDLDVPYNEDPMRLWRNDGGGVMTEVSSAAGVTDVGSGKGLLTFDYDADGDLDLFVVNNAARPVLYRNDGGNSSDWLRVKAMGWGNTHGTGARVAVATQPGGPYQVRSIGAGNNYLGQNEPTAHFGLGTGADPVAEVHVRWPGSRTHQKLVDVPRNTTLVLQEPVPPIRLELNGQHPGSRVVRSDGPCHLTLSVVPGPFTEVVDWYFAMRENGSPWSWVGPDGSLSATPVSILQAAPMAIADSTLLDIVSSEEGSATFALYWADAGGVLTAIDFLTVVVEF